MQVGAKTQSPVQRHDVIAGMNDRSSTSQAVTPSHHKQSQTITLSRHKQSLADAK